MSDSNPKRATLCRLNKDNKEIDPVLEVKFNPKELTFSKSNSWKQNETPKQNAPAIEFTGGQGTSLKLTLTFDTYNTPEAKKKDVCEVYTDKIYQWTFVDKGLENTKSHKGRPPTVRFRWTTLKFDGVIASIGQRLTMFTPEGTPVRAVVDLTLTQVKEELFRQNPTSGGVGGERVWVVREGDTLPWIAFNEYNDATDWRRIADANGLTELRRLLPGLVLVVPNA